MVDAVEENAHPKVSKLEPLFVWGAILAAGFLGIIALYSSGIGLLDPKLHRAGGFILAILVGLAVSRHTVALGRDRQGYRETALYHRGHAGVCGFGATGADIQ